MPDRRFIDTNVLVYAIVTDGSEAAKGAKARELLRSEQVCLSTQVLGEFYQAVTSSRRQSALTHDEAVAWIQLWKRYEVKGISVSHVDLALELTQRFQVNYYDALIIAAARLAGCPILYSEDLNDGQVYDSIRVQNPFRTTNGR
jgi:predicted nucleic acid-binding protein